LRVHAFNGRTNLCGLYSIYLKKYYAANLGQL
jgi:hypothetical protein